MVANEWMDILTRLEMTEECDLPYHGCVTRCDLTDRSKIHVVKLWRGIYLWANDINDSILNFPARKNAGFATINYSISGRCETPINNGEAYVYVEEGMICLDGHGIKYGFYYPGNRYEGIEVAIDLDRIKPGSTLTEFGIDKEVLSELIKTSGGTFIRELDEKTRLKMAELFGALLEGTEDLGYYRFKTVELIRILIARSRDTSNKIKYCSKGQREIAMKVESRLTEDLSKHLVIEDIAKDYGVSSSAVKKYFEQVYGESITSYLRHKRIEGAMILLEETRDSIGSIANRSGYSHQGKFGEVFKEYTGLTPLEYRRLNFKTGRRTK